MRYRYERFSGYDAIVVETEDRLVAGAWPYGKKRIVLKPTNVSKDGAIKMIMTGLANGSTKQSSGRSVDAALRDTLKK